jgi:mannose-6-phosphate isomerase-like protein (cupin superfamily)
MTTEPDGRGYAIVDPDEVDDFYAGSDVPGEFRRLTDALGCRQLSATLIRVPAHSDFEQGTGHFHGEVEELYLITRGTLTMRIGDDVRTVSAHAAVAPQRGGRAGRAVGGLAQARSPRRHEDRRLLGRLTGREPAPHVTPLPSPVRHQRSACWASAERVSGKSALI